MPESTGQGTHMLLDLSLHRHRRQHAPVGGIPRDIRRRQHAAVGAIPNRRHERILREAVESQRGWVFRTVGDGLCAAFANASQAVQAALQAQLACMLKPGERPVRCRCAWRCTPERPKSTVPITLGAASTASVACSGWRTAGRRCSQAPPNCWCGMPCRTA
jgi:hypothetical protein